MACLEQPNRLLQRCPSYPALAPTRAWPVELCQLWLWLSPPKRQNEKSSGSGSVIVKSKKSSGKLELWFMNLHILAMTGREIAFSSDLQPGIGGGNRQGKNTNGLKIQLERILSTLSISTNMSSTVQLPT